MNISDRRKEIRWNKNYYFLEQATELFDRGLSLDVAMKLIVAENSRQLTKWGNQKCTFFEWLAFTVEEVGELSQAMSEYLYRDGDIEDVIAEATQVATLAIKIACMATEAIEGVKELE